MKKIFMELSEEDLRHIIAEELSKAIQAREGPIDNELLNSKEACGFLRITNPTLHSWMKQGKIRGFYLGSKLYFKKNELENALRLRHER